MVGTLLSFSVRAVSIRELARGGLSIFEILAIRSGVALLVLFHFAWDQVGLARLCETPANEIKFFSQYRALRIAIRVGAESDHAAACDGVCPGVHDAGMDGVTRCVDFTRAHDSKPLRGRCFWADWRARDSPARIGRL